MTIVLTVFSGIAWTLVYIEAMRLGFRHRTYAMPAAALALNLAWEWIYAVHGLQGGGSVQGVINLVWGLADLVLLYTFFRFGRRDLPSWVSRPLFVAWGVLLLAIAFAVQWLFVVQFDFQWATRYSAFLQNALMSGLFISFFVCRGGARGQSLTIAVAKWLGTLAPTISVGLLEGAQPFILGLGGVCCLLDMIYVGLLLWARRRPDEFAPATPVPAPTPVSP